MARRREFPGPAMTEKELKDFRNKIALLAPSIVENEYRSVLEKVRMRPLPPPRPVQELVSLWRQLWRWRRR
jgi:hypothetical protein